MASYVSNYHRVMINMFINVNIIISKFKSGVMSMWGKHNHFNVRVTHRSFLMKLVAMNQPFQSVSSLEYYFAITCFKV